MWYRKLTILDRISKRHSRPLDFPLAPLARLELPSRAPRTSLSRASNFPLARLATSLSRASRLEWDFQIAARKASGRMGGAPRGGEGGGSRGEAALAVSHSAARVGGSPLPCARHFLWGTFLRAISCLGSWVVNRPPIILWSLSAVTCDPLRHTIYLKRISVFTAYTATRRVGEAHTSLPHSRDGSP